jgi:biotin operon repressor
MMQIKLNSNINESWIYSVQEEKVFNTIELPIREQEVFLIIYSESNAVSSKEIGRRLGFSDEMVNRYIDNMISKGVPLLIQHKDDEILVSMELKFKDLQAKKNILKIDESISKQLLSDKII